MHRRMASICSTSLCSAGRLCICSLTLRSRRNCVSSLMRSRTFLTFVAEYLPDEDLFMSTESTALLPVFVPDSEKVSSSCHSCSSLGGIHSCPSCCSCSRRSASRTLDWSLLTSSWFMDQTSVYFLSSACSKCWYFSCRSLNCLVSLLYSEVSSVLVCLYFWSSMLYRLMSLLNVSRSLLRRFLYDDWMALCSLLRSASTWRLYSSFSLFSW
mmetsp:Transcript_11515/g.26221  ORF Transcript_11515/g.26221 Transcript_11515/m.26221 type:complete len:212 (-) Transcript_11515:976-1611(-)